MKAGKARIVLAEWPKDAPSGRFQFWVGNCSSFVVGQFQPKDHDPSQVLFEDEGGILFYVHSFDPGDVFVELRDEETQLPPGRVVALHVMGESPEWRWNDEENFCDPGLGRACKQLQEFSQCYGDRSYGLVWYPMTAKTGDRTRDLLAVKRPKSQGPSVYIPTCPFCQTVIGGGFKPEEG